MVPWRRLLYPGLNLLDSAVLYDFTDPNNHNKKEKKTKQSETLVWCNGIRIRFQT